MLERVPFDKKEWWPHAQSITLDWLATHIAEIPHWIKAILENDVFDFGERSYQPRTAASQEELMEIFQTNIDNGIAAIEKPTEADFSKIWVVKRGEQVVFQVRNRYRSADGHSAMCTTTAGSYPCISGCWV